MKTIETSFLSIVLDLASKGVTLDDIFSKLTLVVKDVKDGGHVGSSEVVVVGWEPKLTAIVLFVQVVAFIGVMLFIYSAQASNERRADVSGA